MSIRRPGSPTCCAALPIIPPGGCTSCCPGTGTRRRSGTPSPRKIPRCRSCRRSCRLHAVSPRPRPDAYDVKCKQQKQITTSRQDLDWPWVHSYSYLRGLDGKLPRRKEAKASDSTEDRADAQAADRSTAPSGQEVNKNPERADGQGQLDYLRRLAGLVRTQDQERQQLGQGGIAAIGILGSDVYDKLLILQALRPEFP